MEQVLSVIFRDVDGSVFPLQRVPELGRDIFPQRFQSGVAPIGVEELLLGFGLHHREFDGLVHLR